MKLFTIGYEKRDTDEFFEVLSKNGIAVLADIRAVPYSRRKEFSKKQLAAKLAEAGIEYIHLVDLGGPKELRDKVRADDDYEYFFVEYEKYLDTQKHVLDDLARSFAGRAICLLCLEADENRCHRKSVSEKLSKMADGVFEILHL